MASKVPTAEQIQQILDAHQALLSETNVVSLAVRLEPVPTLVVGVVDGQQEPPVPDSVVTRLPGATFELATKVFEEGEIRAHTGGQVQNAPQVTRPAKGGWGVRTTPLGQGTLGVNITYQGTYRLLSCAHVLTCYDPALVGTMIYQPARIDPAAALVPVTGQVAVTHYTDRNQANPVHNVSDVAYGDITAQLGDPEIEMVGLPAGLRAPDPNTDVDVQLCGLNSGFQGFQIEDFGVRYRSPGVDSAGSEIFTWWRDGMRYAHFGGTRPGDSGAAIVADHDSRVIGLHRAGSAAYGYACPL